MRFEVTLRYSSVKTAWKPLGALWIRLWEARQRSMTTIRTPGARQRLTALLLMMAAGTIPSRSRTKRCKRQNESRERGCDVDRARTRVRYRRTIQIAARFLAVQSSTFLPERHSLL